MRHPVTGLYHLFYQWDPTSNVGFANMHWGHAVSSDMLRWRHLPVALYPDSGSCGGEWSGSATTDAPATAAAGGVVLSYSVQCNSYFGQAVPVDPADPLLLNWTANHVVGHKAPGTGGFRDPSTAWKGEDGVWRQLLACNGAACLYNSTDFATWAFAGHAAGNGTGPTWEMPDIFPLPGSSDWFLKVGGEDGTDYWTTGAFDEASDTFVVGAGAVPLLSQKQRMDFGLFYSSKSFADRGASERALIGWVGEGDGVGSPLKGWAGVQSAPRVVKPDADFPGRVTFEPLASLASLRDNSSAVHLSGVSVPARSALAVAGVAGVQLDVLATFQGPFAPGATFGLAVLATAGGGGADGVNATIFINSTGLAWLSVGPHSGGFRLPAGGDSMDLRVLVDRSMVEVFAAGGRGVATHRAFLGPSSTGVFVVNGGGAPVTVASLDAFRMNNATAPSLNELRAAAAQPRL